MAYKEFQVSAEAVARGREIGVYGDTSKRLARMARRSAPFTGERGNRRFNDFILTTQGQSVIWVERFDPQQAA
jgi:hypothetical protein